MFFGGVFRMFVPDNAAAIVADDDVGNPRFTAGWLAGGTSMPAAHACGPQQSEPAGPRSLRQI